MILVTGATGKIGMELIHNLHGRKVDFRAMVRGDQHRTALEGKGIKTVQGDFDRPDTWKAALTGVSTLFLLTTPRPDIVQVEGAFLKAARAAGVKRVVRLSVMGANPFDASPLIRLHGQCEAQLETCGVDWTLLRPTMFMQNIVPMYGESIAKTSTLYAPAGNACIPWVDCRDIAAVAGVTLTSEGHHGLVYDLTGPDLYTYAGVAELIGTQLGRTIKYVDVPDDAAFHSMTDAGMSPWFAHSILTLFHLLRANGPTAVVRGTIARLTGKAPRTLTAYCTENIAVFRGGRATAPAATTTEQPVHAKTGRAHGGLPE